MKRKQKEKEREESQDAIFLQNLETELGETSSIDGEAGDKDQSVKDESGSIYEDCDEADRPVLIVEADESLSSLIKKDLESVGVKVDCVTTGAEAIEMVERKPDYVLLMDHGLPDMTGTEVVNKLRGVHHEVPFIVMTEPVDDRFGVEMMKLGARDCLLKTPEFLDMMPEVLGRVMGQLAMEKKLSQAEARLTESEKKLSSILDNSVDVIYQHNLETGTFDYLSPSSAKVFGYAPAEAMALGFKEISTLIHPDDRKRLRKHLIKMAKGVVEDPVITIEYRIFHKDSGYRWMSDNRSIVYGDSGKPVAIVGNVKDITARKQTEQALRESEERYRMIAENIADVIWTMDMNLCFTYISPSTTQLTGYTIEEAMTLSLEELLTPASLQIAMDTFESVVGYESSGETNDYRIQTREVEIKRKDGSTIWAEAKVSFTRGPDGNPSGVLGVARDITKSKWAEKELDQIFNTAPDGMRLIDLDFNMVRVNETFAGMIGMTKNQLLGRKCYEVFSNDSCHGTECPVTRVINGEGRIELEIDKKRLDGKVIPCILTATPFIGLDGAILGVVEDFKDITDRKRAEAALRESEERFRQMSELFPFPVWIRTPDGIIEYINPQFTEVFGYTIEDIPTIGDWFEKVYPDAEEREQMIPEWDVDQAMFSASREIKREFEIICKDRKTKIVTVRSLPMQGGRVYKVFHDVTEARLSGQETRRLNAELMESNAVLEEEVMDRKRAEEMLRIAEEKYRTIFDNSAVAITVTDADQKIISWNRFAEGMFGMDADDLYMKPVSSLYPQREWSKIRAQNVIQKGIQHLETRIIKKDGDIIDVRISITVLKDKFGKVTGSIGIIRDITEQKRAEIQLRQAREETEAINVELQAAIENANEMAVQAELASQAKSEFLASMSHEIRTPMNAILGMGDLLSETELTPEQNQYVGTLQVAGENLLCIINDILDISKVEAGHIELEEIGFDLGELIEKTCEVMAVRAHEKFIELGHYIAPDVPTRLIGDPTRLNQVFTNLVSNAVKFTEEGGVFVEMKLAAPQSVEIDSGQVEIVCSVSDTGIGIDAEKVLDVFDAFTQVDASTTRKHGGTGLGLAISKQLVELMGGHIWAESEIDSGSTFNFVVKLKVDTEPALESVMPARVDLNGMKILVVDDTDINRMILNGILSELGAVVIEANDGCQGFNELKRAKESGEFYQLVLLDGRMPLMDGFDMMEKVKRELGTEVGTVLMLTSDSRSFDTARSRDLGISALLTKPIRRKDLLDSIAIAVGQTRIEQKPKKEQNQFIAEDLAALKILLVEDNVDNQLLIQAFLKKTPYEIDIAENGEVAVEKFKADKYDLILMDVQMPVMDGYTATRKIRQWEESQTINTIPIVALTAHATVEDEQKSLDVGCTSHLTKPIKKARLLEAIIEHTQETGKD